MGFFADFLEDLEAADLVVADLVVGDLVVAAGFCVLFLNSKVDRTLAEVGLGLDRLSFSSISSSSEVSCTTLTSLKAADFTWAPVAVAFTKISFNSS